MRVRRKDGAQHEVVESLGRLGGSLLRLVDRPADPNALAGQSARVRHGQAVFPQVDAVGLYGHRDIDSIVHENDRSGVGGDFHEIPGPIVDDAPGRLPSPHVHRQQRSPGLEDRCQGRRERPRREHGIRQHHVQPR